MNNQSDNTNKPEAAFCTREFWNQLEMCNLTKEAVVLLFYLTAAWNEAKRAEEFYVHPAILLSRVRGFTVKNMLDASVELQEHGYISYTAPREQWCSAKYHLNA
jgi:hypothetical protein